MVPVNILVCTTESLLVIFLPLASVISGSKLPLSADDVTMTCQIEYKRYKIVDIKFWFQFDSNINSNISTWDFWLQQCDPNSHNNFCDIWETEYSHKTSCQMVVASSQIYCIKEINLYTEVRSTKPYLYRFYGKHDSKETLSKKMGKIRYLECECKDFDFGQNLQISVSSNMRKADIRIGPFYDIPKLTNTKLRIIPNDALSIKKYNDMHFEISDFKLCPLYNIVVTIKTWPTCTNWKIDSSSLQFSLKTLIVSDILCKYNQTHTILSKTEDNNYSQFYYNLSFIDEIFTKNITRQITLPSKWVKNDLQKNLTVFVKMCIRGCNKCGRSKPFMCYSEIPTQNRKEEVVSKIISPFLWFLLGIVPLVIFAVLFWVNFIRKNSGKTGIANAFSFPKRILVNDQVSQSLNSL